MMGIVQTFTNAVQLFYECLMFFCGDTVLLHLLSDSRHRNSSCKTHLNEIIFTFLPKMHEQQLVRKK